MARSTDSSSPSSAEVLGAAPSRKGLRRRRARRWVAALVLVCACVTIDYWAYPYGAPVDGPAPNRRENGLWLRYTWYFGSHTDAEMSALGDRMRRHGIRYGYFHVRGIARDGQLRYRYEGQAQRLVRALRRVAPGVKLLAWVYAGNPRGEGTVDLARADVRRNMVAEAVWLTRKCGFDGVQWDYEICPDGDKSLLLLLAETRRALPPGALLSVAVPTWMPSPLWRWGWSPGYFAAVASRCDQIAVMCYDTGFVLPRAYVWLASQQPLKILPAARRTNPACRVLIGVPTYGPGFRSHNPRAENLAFALRGVRQGLARSGTAAGSFAGVAVFADYTTDASEWETYDRLWPPVGQK